MFRMAWKYGEAKSWSHDASICSGRNEPLTIYDDFWRSYKPFINIVEFIEYRK